MTLIIESENFRGLQIPIELAAGMVHDSRSRH
jgi:hypothetical protein